MSITNLGKRSFNVLRHSDVDGFGDWVDGEWIEAVHEVVVIKANIQPSMASYRTQLLPSGDREKEAISIYSNDWLYVARTGAKPKEADVVIYRDAHWQVVVIRPYGNFGQHCEALAVKVDDSITFRVNGTIEVIN